MCDATLGALHGVVRGLHAGDDGEVEVGVPVEVVHQTDLEQVALALVASVLASDVPAPVLVLALLSIAVGIEGELHNAAVSELVKGGVEHGGDECPAAWAQGLVVELHQHGAVVHCDQEGVGVAQLYHEARGHGEDEGERQ